MSEQSENNPETLWVGRNESDARPEPAPAGPAAGWYQNPDGPGQRYWDGARWTEHFSGVPAAPPTAAAARQAVRPGAYWAAIAACGAMAIGAFGPWVTAFGGGVTVAGTSGERDGWIVLAAAIIAAVLVWGWSVKGGRGRIGWSVALALIAGAACVYDLVDISNTSVSLFGQQVNVVSAGWGIYLSLAGCGALAIAAWLLRQAETRP
jgi:uncharacterized protein DUF2510